MKPFPHLFSASLRGGPSKYAELTAGDVPLLTTAPPLQFDGPGDAWSPEELFLAAVESCFLFTFQAVARSRTLQFLTLDLDAEGTVDRENRVVRFTEIVLHAVLTVPAGTDRRSGLDALEKAKSACLVSASISTPVRFVEHVRTAEQPALPVAS